MLKRQSIIICGMLLVGCSNAPSEKDIETTINEALKDSCEIAKIRNQEKIDSVERIINDNKYHEVKVKFNASLKYENSDVWGKKYKEYLEKKDKYSTIYKKHLNAFESAENSILNQAIAEVNHLKELLKETSHSLMVPNYKSEKFSEDEMGVDKQEKENNIYRIKDRIRAIVSYTNQKIDVEMKKLLVDYEKDLDLNSKPSFYMKVNSDFLYPFIKDKSKEPFSERYPKGCLYTPNEAIMNLIKTIGYPSEESIGRGFNVNIDMTTFIRKTEKGWSF